jgi:hypothetical protein
MKSLLASVTAFVVLALAVDAQAGCGHCDPKDTSAENSGAGACAGQQGTSDSCHATQCDTSKGCPFAAAMERLPKLTYAVGDKKICCPKEAAKLAKESGGHIHFCVAEKEFDSEPEARIALIEATERLVATLARPHTCPESGQMTLAGQVQSCQKTAAHTADLMQQAIAKVKFTYLVGEKECHCPMAAGKLAKESGKPKLFVVGEEKTHCEKTARLNLARAKYKAAIKAMLQAQAAAAKPEPTAGT